MGKRSWLNRFFVWHVAAGFLMALLLSGCGRPTEPANPTAATTAVSSTVAPPTSSLPATPTRRPPPAVAQNATVTRPAATPTVEPSPTLEPTAAPTEVPPTTVLPAPTETPIPAPTATPEPAASPTIEAVGTDWLQYVNLFRQEANLSLLSENTVWSAESGQHSRYMALTGDLRHSQNTDSPYATRGGQLAAENGNIAAGYIQSDPFKWAFNYWMSAPFHAIPIIDPQLQSTGFSEYRDASAVQPLTATMDVRRGLGALPAGTTYPIMYPRPGGLTWVLRYSLPEFPEALSHCAGYQQPTGAPIILQIGDGSQVPQVTGTGLFKDGVYLAHCYFSETTFTHPDAYRQKSARLILDNRDAVVIIPQQPLLPDSTYSVRVDVNGATYTWSFRTAAGPPG